MEKKIGREEWVQRIKLDQKEKRIEDIPTKRSFKVGEQVLVKRETRTKEQDRYEGPYEIEKKVHERRYNRKDNRKKHRKDEAIF